MDVEMVGGVHLPDEITVRPQFVARPPSPCEEELSLPPASGISEEEYFRAVLRTPCPNNANEMTLLHAMEVDLATATDDELRAIASYFKKKIIHSSSLCTFEDLSRPRFIMNGNAAETFVRDATSGRVFPVSMTDPFVFGHGEGSDVDLMDLQAPEAFSSPTAVITFDSGTFYIQCEGSTGLVFVNYTRLDFQAARLALSKSSILEVAGLRFVFHLPARVGPLPPDSDLAPAQMEGDADHEPG